MTIRLGRLFSILVLFLLVPMPVSIARELTMGERVEAQRAIEGVFWSHRIWPQENATPKPGLANVVGDAALRAKVERYLRESAALESLWQRPITGEQLQAELERMAARSRDPRVLGEIFEALGNDPEVIAETLARATLADRLVRSWYPSEDRPFEEWWKGQEADLPVDLDAPRYPFTLPLIDASPCTADTWSPTLQDAPDGRQDHVSVWTGSELIIWGGTKGLVMQNTGGRYSPATDSWVLTSTGPGVAEGRWVDTAVWTGTEMIVWGGYGGVNGTDLLNTGGRYNPATDTWAATSTGANVPTPRNNHTAVWTGSEMIVWGGFIGSGYVNTGGRYNPSTNAWTATSVTGSVPTARGGQVAVWTGTQMVIWSGGGTTGTVNTGGRYTPSSNTWTATSVGANVPAARSHHSAVWTGTQMVVWGGEGPSDLNTGGRYNPSTNVWTATSTGANVPTARADHSAIWTGTEMIVWGGVNGNTPTNTGARYNPTADTWTATSTGANVPTSRSDHTAVWTGSEMIVWGSIFSNTGGRYSPASNTWVKTSVGTVPSARYQHGAVWTGSEMIVWGGAGETTFGTGARYTPATDTWAPTATLNAPPGRSILTAVWTGTRAIFWGGIDQVTTTRMNSGGLYDPSTDSWTATSTGAFVPSARQYATAVWTGKEMIVWGGSDGVALLGDGGRYDPATNAWSPLAASGAPTGRISHTAIWTGGDMVVWGGQVSTGYTNSGGRYSPSTDSWLPTSTGASVPAARAQHAAAWTGARMVVWGGQGDFGPPLTVGGRYDPATDTWTTTTTSGVLAARSNLSAAWTGAQVLFWGGGGSSAYANDGSRYDPVADTWTPMTLTGAPDARQNHSAVWTGDRMIVWGGYPITATGGIYCACPNGRLVYRDADGDGFGILSVTAPSCDGSIPAGYAADATDCDDTNAAIHPGAAEVCNGADDDCDLAIDDGIPAPTGVPDLTEGKTGSAADLSWSAVSGVTGYDVVKGSLGTLRASDGDFSAATTSCLANDVAGTTAQDGAIPSFDQGLWYLVRAVNACGGAGSYDEGSPGQSGSRDAEIAGASGACP